jgi:hypothetical protein
MPESAGRWHAVDEPHQHQECADPDGKVDRMNEGHDPVDDGQRWQTSVASAVAARAGQPNGGTIR